MTSIFSRRPGAAAFLAIAACMVTAIAARTQPLAVQGAARGDGTTVYTNARFGFSLRYPTAVFQPSPEVATGEGMLWRSADGRARLLASAGRNETSETLASYRAFVLASSYPAAKIDYAPVRSSWFVLSGELDGTMFYERITFVCGGRYIYGWQITYPAEERGLYDRIIEDVHRSYRPGRGPDGDCG